MQSRRLNIQFLPFELSRFCHARCALGGRLEAAADRRQLGPRRLHKKTNPCSKWEATFRHPLNPCIKNTFLTPQCKICYKSLHETHLALCATPPGTTMYISSLRQDPLVQALFGEHSENNARVTLKHPIRTPII